MKKNKNRISKEAVKKQLEKVIDPELGISIVDLGLIYQIKVTEKEVYIKMTLTTMGCPLFSLIEEEIKNKINQLGIDKEKIKVELTFDPPWTMERLSPAAKALLGI